MGLTFHVLHSVVGWGSSLCPLLYEIGRILCFWQKKRGVDDKESDLPARYVEEGETRIFGKCVKMEVGEDDSAVGSLFGMAT